MDTKPEISVIIPTYHRPEAVKRAIRSVLRQTEKNFEVIVVNDGDDCGLGDYFSELADKRCIYTNNLRTKGGNGARNTGVDLAQADYIAFLDDDDEWHEDKIMLHLKAFKDAGGKGCSVSSFYLVPKDYECQLSNDKIRGYAIQKAINTKNILLGIVSFGGSSTLIFEKQFIIEIGCLDESLMRHQDLELMLRASYSSSVFVCNKKLVYIHGHNRPTLEKAEETKKQYWLLVDKYLMQLSKSEQKHFYANEYKDLAILAARNRNKKKTVKYILESLKRDIIPSRKYLKVLYNIFLYFVLNRR